MYSLILTVTLLVGTSLGLGDSAPPDDSSYEGPLLSSFQSVQQQYDLGTDGVYRFYFTLPQQERYEERDSEGAVTGSFAFVAKSGEEVAVNYAADDEGFRPESDALPQSPVDTDEVQKAREEFLEFYRKTVEYLETLDSDESSEESDEDDDDDSFSSEEESSEEDDDDDDEEEEEEEK